MDDSKEARQYLRFLLNKQQILLPVAYVQQVFLLPALQMVPDVDPAFQGILDFHGECVPIYDLSLLISKNALGVSSETPVLLVSIEEKLRGYLVTEVCDLISIATTALQAPERDAMPFVEAIYEAEQQIAWVLNLSVLMKHHREGQT